MAERFVKVSLGTKIRVLFGAAVLLIIAAALVAPWYFMELLAERGVERSGTELARLRLNEWIQKHPERPKDQTGASQVAALHTIGEQLEGRKGPLFVKLTVGMKPDRPLDATGRHALKAFARDADQMLAIIKDEDDKGRSVYRCLRAVRIEPMCKRCHDLSAKVRARFQPGQLVAMIDVSLPASAAAGKLVWYTRAAFVIGVSMAAALAVVLFAVITHRLILRPVRHLRDVSSKVAEGDLAVRSTISTGDELQQLGESFNEMLAAIADQHDKLRAANRALDLKLSELAEANVTLFEANRVKSEFLTNVSHELRTPLNSILGFADLLKGHDDERICRYGANISAAAKDLLNMINDLLDLAKIEAGKAEVHFDKVSVTDTCRTLVALMGPQADKKQLQLRATLPGDVPIINTDGGKLQQILYNLLSNAIKFTPAGGKVTLSTQTGSGRRGRENTEEVSVAVADTGPGIAEANQRRIFEKFYQVDGTLTRQSSGTGLGLAIARELTNLLGGRLTLKSSPGHGATFTVSLPVDARPAARPINTRPSR